MTIRKIEMKFLKRTGFDKVNFALVLALLTYATFVQFPSYKNIAIYVYSDSANYASLALRFAQGNFDKAIHVWWLPFYSFAGGFFYQFTHDIDRALLFVSMFSGIFLIVPVFYLINEVTKDKLLSFMGAILAAFNPVSIRNYLSLLTENLYTFTLILSCYLAVFALKRNSKITALAAGVSFGLSFMTRNEAAAFLIFFWLFCLFIIFLELLKGFLWGNKTHKNQGKIKIKNMKFYPLNIVLGVLRIVRSNGIIQLMLLSMFAFIITIAPYYLFMATKFGYINLSARYKAANHSYHPNSLAPNHKTTWSQDIWSVDSLNYKSIYLNTDPKKVKFNAYIDDLIDGSTKRANKYIGIFREEFGDRTLILMLFGLIYSLGLLIFRKRPNEKVLILLNLFLITGPIMVLPFLPGAERRYMLWIYPFFYIFIFVGFYSLKHFLKSKYIGYLITASAFYFFILTFKSYLAVLPPAFGTLGNTNDYIEVSEFIKKQGNTNPRIMSRREAIAYYAKGETIFVPDDDITQNEVRDYLRYWKVNYIIASLENIGTSKGYAFLLEDKSKIPDWLKVIKEYGEGRTRIIIYEVRDNM